MLSNEVRRETSMANISYLNPSIFSWKTRKDLDDTLKLWYPISGIPHIRNNYTTPWNHEIHLSTSKLKNASRMERETQSTKRKLCKRPANCHGHIRSRANRKRCFFSGKCSIENPADIIMREGQASLTFRPMKMSVFVSNCKLDKQYLEVCILMMHRDKSAY